MKKAIVIGAGPAGLTAAYHLLEQGDVLPIVLEKEAFVGGISRTYNHRNNRIDIGGHRFFSKSQDVVDVWNKIMPMQGLPAKDDALLHREKEYQEGGPDPEQEDEVFLIRSRISRIFYRKKFFDYPLSLKMETLMNMGLWNTWKAGWSYLLSQVVKRKEDSLEDFLINRFGERLYEMFFHDYTRKVWGQDPSQISADWGAQRIKGLSLTKALWHMLRAPFQKGRPKQVETSLIDQFIYPKFGPGQYWQAMADRIVEAGGQIILGAKVNGLKRVNHGIQEVAYETEKDGIKRLTCDYVLSSMPIPELMDSLGDIVPDPIKRVADGLMFRDFITVGLLVKELNIKNTTSVPTVKDRIPDCWIYVQDPEVMVGRLQIFNNWSPYMVRDFEQSMWVGLEYFCQENDELWSLPDDEMIALAAREAQRLGFLDTSMVLDSVCLRVPKAYPAYFGSYDQFSMIRAYLDQVENLYCIGRNGQHRYNNMDHSMLSAMEAVKLIYAGTVSKKSLWQINTEAAYHEENES